MPKSFKRADIALIGLAVLLVGFGLIFAAVELGREQAKHRQERERASTYQTEGARGKIEATCVQQPGSRAYRCTADVPVSDNHDPYAEYDLRAQQDMARASFVVAVLGIGSLLLTVVAVVLLWWTLEATREAVSATVGANTAFVEHSKRELRAYLSVVEITGTFKPIPPNAPDESLPEHIREAILKREMAIREIELTVTMKNFGHTPARNVQRKFDIFDEKRRSFQVQHGVTGRIGLSPAYSSLDLAPGAVFRHEYRFKVIAKEPRADGIQISGYVNYADFSGDRWGVDIKCESRPFDTTAPTSIEFGEITQFEQRYVGSD